MCNLYKPDPGAVEHFVPNMRSLFDIPGFDPEKVVGPFNLGIFVRARDAGLVGQVGQWGMIRPGQPTRIERLDPKTRKVLPPDSPIKGIPRATNNARYEGIEKKNTFSAAWRQGKRCLVPAAWYQEPNWETKKNIWWQLKRADGRPWWLAGLWDEWTDPKTGEIVPNFTMITMNCTGHPLLGRLHRDDLDPETKKPLPADKQDKRSLIHIDPEDWQQWLTGSEEKARALIKLQPLGVFDQTDARRTDEVLASLNSGGLC